MLTWTWLYPSTLILFGGLAIFAGDLLLNWAWDNKENSTHYRKLIPLSAIVIVIGGIAGTHGWNEWSEIAQRQEMIASVANSCKANYSILRATTNLDLSDKNTLRSRLDEVHPAETVTFISGLASGLFIGTRHEELRERIRLVQSVLTEYNYSLSYKYADTYFAQTPRNLQELSAQGLQELRGLAQLLEQQYGATPLTL